jgi:hypothetical protein
MQFRQECNAITGHCFRTVRRPFVAHLRHSNGHWERLFIGAHRKSSARSQNGAFDPLLTSPDKNILSQSEWFPALAMGGHNV